MKTELISIIDESGSMALTAEEVRSGYNDFLKEQRAQPGEAKVTTVLFDHRYKVIDAGMPIGTAQPLTAANYHPSGMTALYDAIGRTLDTEGKRIAGEKWADLVIVCIITDGQENASHEYTQARIKEMVGHAEKCGWKFVYLAANQDAFAAAASIGTQSPLVSNYAAGAAGTKGAMRGHTMTASALRSGQTLDSQWLSTTVADATK